MGGEVGQARAVQTMAARVHSRMGILSSGYPASRCTGRCAATGRVFSHGELIVAVLVERADGGLERLDYGLESWEAGQRPQPPMVVFGFWRCEFTPEEKKSNALLGDAELLDLFEDLAGAAEPKQIAFRYFLALLLVRRRMLRVTGSREGALLVLPKGVSGEPVAVVDPGLEESVVGDAIEQLGRVVAPVGADGAKAP
ncbi:hypothetical protein PHYC_02770 [Phycisphaerales bacterium]|nr:hypothetical protein PHYC_02770 [Phycisphaerales bacterium]